MTSVLVTGGSGFIGRWVVAELIARRYEVHVVGHGPRRVHLPGAVVDHEVDLLDPVARPKTLARVGCDHLIHLAWETTRGSYWTSPLNEAWSATTVELVRQFWCHGGQRVVVAGTCAEYDWEYLDHHDGLCNEWTTPTLPSTPYGRAKVAAYQDLVGDPRACQLVWGRLFFPFGSGEASDRLIPFVVNALLDGQPPVVRTGHLVRDFLHAAEVARAFVDLLESNVSGAVNVASGTGITIAALVKELAALVGRPELVQLGAQLASKGDPPRLVADVTRLREDVGYRPTSDLRAGLAHVVSELRVERNL